MAAGVHLARHLGLVGNILGILQGQRIEVGAKCDDGAIGVALNVTQNAGLGKPVHMLDAELVEAGLHLLGGAVLLESELWMLVEIPTDLDHPGKDLTRCRQNLRR